ncbi:MAG: hypothetical protein A2Z72_02285 [Omnitrophica bacterium RBG_13_46_9]|nr:MAG: hypothetical protein A2Z72_02285 [Omnitrophica bacterium RBG_13_46_9]
MHQNGLGLKNLVNLEDWHSIQDSFSDSLGITLRTIDLKGRLLSSISGQNRLCSKVFQHTQPQSEFCGNCVLRPNIHKEVKIKEDTSLKCPFDLDIFVLPIKAFGNRIVAYIVIGPLILNKRKDKSIYAECVTKAGIDVEELIDALIDINVFSYTKIRSVIKLLKNIFSYMAQTGYHKKRLGEIGYEVIEMDPLFSSIYEEKVLNALLNTCAIAFDADSGSVMTVDKNTNHLHIKAASKLDEDIINSTDIRVGEGIAGLAAATAKSIILPKDMNKNGIFKKMKRQYIKSSMIVPFSKANDHDVYGVINLNVLRKNRDFSDKDITLAKELINLASIALVPVK